MKPKIDWDKADEAEAFADHDLSKLLYCSSRLQKAPAQSSLELGTFKDVCLLKKLKIEAIGSLAGSEQSEFLERAPLVQIGRRFTPAVDSVFTCMMCQIPH